MKLSYGFCLSILLATVLGAIEPQLCAQQIIPLQNQAAAASTTERLEVEVIEIRHGTAMPAAIHRHVGKFILLVVNHTHDPAASFVLDPASVGEGAVGPNPFLRLTDQPASSRRRIAGLTDLPAGQFDLKSAVTGKILCRITIE